MIVHQASAVVIDGRALLIEGPPGSGKSSLALALIDRGAILLGDDGVVLSAPDGRLCAAPHPNTAGLIEVRNLGILPFPHAGPDPVPVALVVVLDRQAPRFVEAAQTVLRGGWPVPLLHLWPESQALPLRAELALRHHGLA